jgi:hypothetical protein
VFSLCLSRPIGLLPFLFPFRPHRSCTGGGEVWQLPRRPPATAFQPPTCAESLLSQREEQGKDGGRGARLVSKPGSHRYRTGGEPEGGEGGIHQSRNGNGYARKCEIKPECDKLNTPGRESFSEEASSMWLAVARKRLPTPFALRTTQPNPTVIVLPVLGLDEYKLNMPGQARACWTACCIFSRPRRAVIDASSCQYSRLNSSSDNAPRNPVAYRPRRIRFIGAAPSPGNTR